MTASSRPHCARRRLPSAASPRSRQAQAIPRTSRSPSSCRSPPAARPTSSRARSGNRVTERDEAGRSSSTTRPAPAACIAAQAVAQRAGRRLHRADHHQHDARGQRAPVQEAALRPGEGLRAGHRRSARAGRCWWSDPTSPYKTRRRASSRWRRRSRASSASAAAVRRAASRARCCKQLAGIEILHVPYKSNPLARDRPARRPDRHDDHRHRDRRAAGQGRQAARARRLDAQAHRRCCPTCRPSTRPASRATRWATGSGEDQVVQALRGTATSPRSRRCTK